MSARPLLAFAVATLALAAPARAGEASFVVNSTLDLPDLTPPGDGHADADLETEGDQITLRAALQESNALPGEQTIELPAGKFKLTLKGAQEDECATGDLDVTGDVHIFGLGSDSTIIDGKKAKDRVFDVHSGTLQLIGLTVRGGKASADESGGGVSVRPLAILDMIVCTITKCAAGDDGGGLDVEGGSAFLTDCVVTGNKAGDDGGGLDADDSGVALVRSTFSSNKAGDEGGGVENSHSEMTITNCTLARNKAKNDAGGLSLEDGGATVILNCTIAGNRAKVGSGIDEALDDAAADDISITNTILSNKKSTNYAGDGFTSGGHNIDSGTTGGLLGTGDLTETNPRLSGLKDNGGQTPTMALKDDSPAIDAGDDGAAPIHDQRNATRVDTLPNRAISDIGAFELGGEIFA